MNIPYLSVISHPTQKNRILLLSTVTACTLAVNLFGILAGLTAVLSHLLYFPIILASYWYPRRGLSFSLLVAALFALQVILFAPLDLVLGLATITRCAILVLVGCVVSLLSWNLAQSEKQLQDIIEFLPDATFAIDKEGKIIAWNRALELMTGRLKASMLNRGNHEYALAFYGDRRPMLAGLIIGDGSDIPKKYPQVRNESGTLISEIFLPQMQGDRGMHLRFSASPLLDANGNIAGAIESIRDITDRVMTASALEKTSHRLNTLAGILRHDISRKLAVLYGQLRFGVMKFSDPEIIAYIGDLKVAADGITRQIDISREFRDIGGTPPSWIAVQNAIATAADRLEFRNVTFHAWTDRLCAFSDPHLPTVFYHILHNSLQESTHATKIVITYQVRPEGCAIIIEDDGTGIPEHQKDALFVQREDSYGRGLFLAAEIVSLTGMTLRETGEYRKGARFEILVPPEGYRIENAVTRIAVPQRYTSPDEKGGPVGRELLAGEFSLADEIWKEYHDTSGDPAVDRIFGVYQSGELVSIARCRRHPDGLEVDGVFTPASFRKKGYSRIVVGALVEACHNDDLFMYAVRHLEGFYHHYGFEPIPETLLPPAIRERYTWAAGNLEGAEVLPMRRKAGL
ncbi:PAS domain S-box protein [Methanoregula sp.]|uniref:GNAT family N-acetyltransferase n=1 Tax=Methanoregula sp. TaxID=2052170 RepID=UPI002613A883|nr:PAS domain S-box protein [Methanoregula sp.]MDD5142424.1 PAS domain S-box protein [Methanoregula sp.]